MAAPTISNEYFASATATSSCAKTSVVVGSGEGIVVLVHCTDIGTATTVSGVTFGGESLTSQGTALTSADGVGAVHRHAAYYLANPTPGTQTVTATLAASQFSSGIQILVVAGHDTTSMIRGYIATAVGGATSPTTSLTTVADDLVFDLLRFRDGGGPGAPDGPGAGQTQITNEASAAAGSWYYAASYEVATGTSTTMSWTEASDSAWNLQAIAIAPTTGGGSAVGAAAYYFSQQ